VIKLIGILVVAVGFALRFNTLLVVVAAGIATGLVAGLSFHEIMTLFGTYFVDNRFMTLPVILMLPVVGLLERHGLQERVADLIQRSRAATSGRVLLLYHALRAGTSTVAINIGNHASMIRPIVAPMAEGAARARHPGVTPAQVAEIRAHAAAAENLGNFFADDIIVAVGPVLLIKGFYDSVGISTNVMTIAYWGAPTAVFVLGVGWWRYRALDARLAGLPRRSS
jgi:uncharacterized membrane protein